MLKTFHSAVHCTTTTHLLHSSLYTNNLILIIGSVRLCHCERLSVPCYFLAPCDKHKHTALPRSQRPGRRRLAPPSPAAAGPPSYTSRQAPAHHRCRIAAGCHRATCLSRDRYKPQLHEARLWLVYIISHILFMILKHTIQFLATTQN